MRFLINSGEKLTRLQRLILQPNLGLTVQEKEGAGSLKIEINSHPSKKLRNFISGQINSIHN